MPLTEVVVLTQPKVEPVSRAEAKRWMNIDDEFTDDDALIVGMITTARINVERFLGRALISQVRQAYWDSIRDRIWMPYPPIINVDEAIRIRLNEETTLTENSDYFVQGIQDLWLRMATPFNLPAGHSPNDRFSEFELKVKYTAGYGTDATDVPETIREAIKMIVATSYANRGNISEEEMTKIPAGAKFKLYPFKIIL